MEKKIKILATLGPKSLNKRFLNFAKKSHISYLRLNMSHIDVKNLSKIINFIRKHNNKTPICIDTEGAQIRTKVKSKKLIKKNKIFKLFKNKNLFNLYPDDVFDKLKKGDLLSIGFDNLKAVIIKKTKKFCILRSVSPGLLESNKGVHLENRKIKLNYLTKKDLKAIEIGKICKINNYAL